MKFVKRTVMISLIAILCLFAFLLRRSYFASPMNTSYRVVQIKSGDIQQTVSANGTLNPITLVSVGTQISGQVTKIYADFNDYVKQDQILLELDKTLLIADVQQGQASLHKAEASLTLAQANENRSQSLLQKGYISKEDWDQLVQLRKAAQADLEIAKAQLSQAEINLTYATIRSPVSGIVIDREVDVGQTVAASFQTPTLFQIAQDLRKMQIDSSFAEADIGSIQPDQKVIFTVDAFPNRTFTGTVKQIRLNPTIQQNVVTYNVVIHVDNPEGILLPGMTAYVSIQVAEHKNVLLVPNDALRFKPATSKAEPSQKNSENSGTLYKVTDKALEPVSCHIGITNNHFTEISHCDLKEGDEIAISENQNGSTPSTRAFRIRVF